MTETASQEPDRASSHDTAGPATEPDADLQAGRRETVTERYDRNWHDIQQELRITQTGTQLLAGFLLTLPFQNRFGELSDDQTGIYLTLVALAAAISVFALTPVSAHRLLFRHRQMRTLVTIGDRILLICMIASAILFSGTVLLIFDVVLNRSIGVAAGTVLFVATALLWVAVPISIRRRRS